MHISISIWLHLCCLFTMAKRFSSPLGSTTSDSRCHWLPCFVYSGSLFGPEIDFLSSHAESCSCYFPSIQNPSSNRAIARCTPDDHSQSPFLLYPLSKPCHQIPHILVVLRLGCLALIRIRIIIILFPGNPLTPSRCIITRDTHKPVSSTKESKSAIPRKNPEDGKWEYLYYVPPWMDPNWRDDGPERPEWQKSDMPINDTVLDRVRPALLIQDHMSNPTQYSQRFGIFPGRSDGRSRTSPTRTEKRKLKVEGHDLTGKEICNRIDAEAHKHGKSAEDLEPDLESLSPTAQAYVQAYQDLLIDEYWQGLVFGNRTMDEVSIVGSMPKTAR